MKQWVSFRRKAATRGINEAYWKDTLLWKSEIVKTGFKYIVNFSLFFFWEICAIAPTALATVSHLCLVSACFYLANMLNCRVRFRLRPHWWKAQPHDLIKPCYVFCVTHIFTSLIYRRWTSIKRRWPGERSGSWPLTRTQQGLIRS